MDDTRKDCSNKNDKELRKLFCSTAFYSDRLDLSRKVLRVYNSLSAILNWPSISSRHFDLTAYYICYGYSENTQKRYMDDFNLDQSMISVMNSEMKKKGLLVDAGGNYRTRDLSPRLQRFRQYFARGDPGAKTIVINFIRKDFYDD